MFRTQKICYTLYINFNDPTLSLHQNILCYHNNMALRHSPVRPVAIVESTTDPHVLEFEPVSMVQVVQEQSPRQAYCPAQSPLDLVSCAGSLPSPYPQPFIMPELNVWMHAGVRKPMRTNNHRKNVPYTEKNVRFIKFEFYVHCLIDNLQLLLFNIILFVN